MGLSDIFKATKAKGAEVARQDDWRNTVTGLGNINSDRQQSHQIVLGLPSTPAELNALFHDDPLARRICTQRPQDALREGFGIESSEDRDGDDISDDAGMVEDELTRLDLLRKVYQATVWGQVFGLGAVLLGEEGADLSTPMELKGKPLSYAVVLERFSHALLPCQWYGVEAGEKVGQVELYQCSKIGESAVYTKIHESRLLIFGGETTSSYQRERNSGVDYSLLHLCKKALRDYDALVSSVGNMVTDASTPVLKIKGFHEALTSAMTGVIKARVALVDMLKWVGRVMPVDSDGEDFQIHDRTFTGLPEVWDRGELRLCACSRYPATLLFGRSPAGMNATGDSDIRLYYDTVSWFREHYLGPELDRLVKILAASLGLADPESWFVSWPSLWQRNPTEEAAHRKAVAETDAIMISNGVVTEDEVALTRFGRPGEFRDGPVEINVESRSLDEPDEPDPFEGINPLALGAAMAQTEKQEPEQEEEEDDDMEEGR